MKLPGIYWNRGSVHPAAIAGPKDRIASKERLEGFLKGLADAGLSLKKIPVRYGDFEFKSGFNITNRLLKQQAELDGIFLCQ